MTANEVQAAKNDRAILRAAAGSVGRRSWICYDRAARILWRYSTGADSTRALAADMSVSVETLRLWACAGKLRSALRGMTFTDESQTIWNFWTLRQSLSLTHFLIAGKYFHGLELDPQDVLEWLVIAAADRKSAAWLGAQLSPESEGLFVKRLERLFATDLPQDWTTEKRRAVEVWLDEGRRLL